MDCLIKHSWDGSEPAAPFESPYKIRLEIVRGEVQFQNDAPYWGDPAPPAPGGGRFPGLFKHECVEIFIAAGDPELEAEERPYLEVELGPHGHFFLIGLLGQQQWASQDDSLVFDQDPGFVIVDGRWRCKGRLPFYLLPEPWGDPKDPLSLQWKINCVASHGQGTLHERHHLSQNKLPTLNFHQVDHFSPFVLSDSDAQRIASLSRSTRGWSSVVPSLRALRLKSSVDKTPRTLNQVIEWVRRRGKTEKHEKDIAKFSILLKGSLMEGEEILLLQAMWKRKGFWSNKHRLLVLTSKPRLIYFRAAAPYELKGGIEWSMLRPVDPSRLDGHNDRFDIELFDKSRRYHWHDNKDGGRFIADWVAAISEINQFWRQYREIAGTGAYTPIPSYKDAEKLGQGNEGLQCNLL